MKGRLSVCAELQVTAFTPASRCDPRFGVSLILARHTFVYYACMMKLLIQYDRKAKPGPESITGVAPLSEVAALLGLEIPHHDASVESKTIPLIDLTRTSRDVIRLLDDNFLRAPAHRHLLAELDKRHSDGISWSGDVRVIERTLAPWWRAINGSAEATRRWRPGIDAAVILANTAAAAVSVEEEPRSRQRVSIRD